MLLWCASSHETPRDGFTSSFWLNSTQPRRTSLGSVAKPKTPHPSPTQLLVLLGIGLLFAGLAIYPAAMAFVLGHPHQVGIVAYTALTCVILAGGLVGLSRAHDLSRPAKDLHIDALIFLLAVTVPWAMVIVESPDASYFLTALALLASWLLPPIAGAIATAIVAGFTVAGQVFHHGLTAGTVVGPIVVAVLIVAFVAMIRMVYRSSDASKRLLVQLRESQAETAQAEREAGRHAERARIGRDLHDTVAQSLSSIQLLLQAAERATEPAQVQAHLTLARQTAHESLAETRAFIGELTPPDLVHTGLVQALGRLAREVRIPTSVTVDGTERRLDARSETAIFRVAQESLRNVDAHSLAQSCQITLSFEPSEVVLEIDDDGCGFDLEAVSDKGRFGLQGMRARMEELGGTLAVVSSGDDGTLVAARVPA